MLDKKVPSDPLHINKWVQFVDFWLSDAFVFKVYSVRDKIGRQIQSEQPVQSWNTVSLSLIPKQVTVQVQGISVNQDGWGQDVSTVKKNWYHLHRLFIKTVTWQRSWSYFRTGFLNKNWDLYKAIILLFLQLHVKWRCPSTWIHDN